jgi:hypothetical protein
MITPLVPGDTTLTSRQRSDYTIILTWAKYFGKFNNRQFLMEKVACQNTKARIRVIFLNTDIQETWNMAKHIRLIPE